MKNYLCSVLILLLSTVFAEENWQNHWHMGCDLFYSHQFEDASLEFDLAINLLSEEELQNYPYVLINRAENNYFLQNYADVMQDTEKALKSEKLTDYERLTCGLRRISVFAKCGKRICRFSSDPRFCCAQTTRKTCGHVYV